MQADADIGETTYLLSVCVQTSNNNQYSCKNFFLSVEVR